MKTLTRNLLVAGLLTFSWNAHAGFFDGDDCPPWEYDCNDWPEWTPMYWMEEFADEFDDDDEDWYRYGYGPAPYGPPPMYGPAPYGPPPGFAPPPPYGRPLPPPGVAPAPYGRPLPPPGFAPAPYGRPPMPAPYGRPVPPRPAPQQQQNAPQGK